MTAAEAHSQALQLLQNSLAEQQAEHEVSAHAKQRVEHCGRRSDPQISVHDCSTRFKCNNGSESVPDPSVFLRLINVLEIAFRITVYVYAVL